MSRFYVFTGNFGSGKSELAINMAIARKATLVDLDVVNPYFKSGERMGQLQEEGIRLIAPNFLKEKLEIVSLSPEVYAAFAAEGDVIFDAGGDMAGSTALGSFNHYFTKIPKEDLQVFFVLNPFRPMTDTAEKALEIMRGIELASRLPVTGLINNANLGEETEGENLLEGYEAVKELSNLCGVPVAATTGTKEALSRFMSNADRLDNKYIGEPIEISVKMNRSWGTFLGES